MRLIRAILFSAFLILNTVFTAIVCLILSPFPVRLRYYATTLYSNSTLFALALICGVKYTVEGREHLPDSPVIIFCKHQSTWDTYLIQTLFFELSFVFKQELLWLPFFGWGLATMKPVAIKRGTGRKAVNQVVNKGTARLNAGINVIIFPEGTRTAANGPGKYHIGGAILAEKSGFPIIPIAHNAGEFWPRKGFLKKPGTIKVRIGPLIYTEGKKAEDILEEARVWIESQMIEITEGPYEAA